MSWLAAGVEAIDDEAATAGFDVGADVFPFRVAFLGV
jgi:hypothetical protein